MKGVAGVLLLIISVACGGAGDAEAPLRVLAASSLTDALTDAAAAFEQETATPVEVSFAGSQALVTQIEGGIAADVLVTADEESMQRALDGELVGKPTVIATNRLALIAPASSGAATRLDDLAEPGVRLVLAAPEVPAGRYARAVLRGAGILEGALRNVVSEEEDVKGVVGKVASGEADAGIAYVTDVTESLKDRVRASPLDSGVVVRYPAAVAGGSERAEQAGAFLRFLATGSGARILADAGFGAP